MLKQKCKEHNLLFINISTYYQNDDTIYPLHNLCNKSKMFELDYRIKDNSVHVHINNPEGIECAFNLINLPINIKHYTYENKCKYNCSLNKFQRDYYKRIRISHYVYVGILGFSLFLPNNLILIPATLICNILILNYMFSGRQYCFFNTIEFRSSNCNNKSMIDGIRIS